MTPGLAHSLKQCPTWMTLSPITISYSTIIYSKNQLNPSSLEFFLFHHSFFRFGLLSNTPSMEWCRYPYIFYQFFLADIGTTALWNELHAESKFIYVSRLGSLGSLYAVNKTFYLTEFNHIGISVLRVCIPLSKRKSLARQLRILRKLADAAAICERVRFCWLDLMER